MTERMRLPNRRLSENFVFEIFDDLKFTATVSRFDNGGVAEIFLQNHKAQSAAGILASDSAVAASLALQYGCPLEILQRALMRDANGRATGALGRALDLAVEIARGEE